MAVSPNSGRTGGSKSGKDDKVNAHVDLMRESWAKLHEERGFGAISFLSKASDQWDESEFFLAGERMAQSMIARFDRLTPGRDYSRASLLEIGCGVGRLLKAYAKHFKRVVGVDISEEALASARDVLKEAPNVELYLNNGLDLSEFSDDTFDFCFCVGVFHHITLEDVVANYVREAIRVIKPGGLFVFHFLGNRPSPEAESVLKGARLTAKGLDQALQGSSFRIRELFTDSGLRNAPIVVTLQKAVPAEIVSDSERLFRMQKLDVRSSSTTAYDGLKTPVLNQIRNEGKQERVTFFDD